MKRARLQSLLVLDPPGRHLMGLLTKAAKKFNLGVIIFFGQREALTSQSHSWHVVTNMFFFFNHFQKAIEQETYVVKIMNNSEQKLVA